MFCSRLAEWGVTNTAGGSMGWGGPQHVLSQNHQAYREESEKHCWGFGGAGSQWGAHRFISPDVFCLSSTRHHKVVAKSPGHREERVVVKPNTAGGSVGGLGPEPLSVYYSTCSMFQCFNIDLNFIRINILTKFHELLIKTVPSPVYTRIIHNLT